MVDAPLRLLACVLPATALSQGRGYGSTSAATKTIVSGLTQLVNLNGGAKPANKKRPRRFASLTPQQVKAGLADDFRNEYLWSGRITPELYDEACVFTDPTLSFRGLDVFEANLRNLDPWIERFVPSERRRVDLYALAVDGTAITASWRMVGTLALPWRPRLDLNGTTTYTLNGAGGRISSYDETWALSAGEALLQLLTPAAQEVEEIVEPEFWPGRLAGRAPTPKARAPLVNPPTVVVLPGPGPAPSCGMNSRRRRPAQASATTPRTTRRRWGFLRRRASRPRWAGAASASRSCRSRGATGSRCSRGGGATPTSCCSRRPGGRARRSAGTPTRSPRR
mmetsp:Transcript_14040/g.43624  ORF Transcript_14040/g.43624 Transcript_14040/m.43624 type:complete len:338 (+) Transcript_14040:130-1143(+)